MTARSGQVRCKKQEDRMCEEGLPPWMATFADMVSLLLTFFVLLLSFANMDIQKFQDMMGSVRDAFGVQVKRPPTSHVAFSPSLYERQDVALDRESKAILDLTLQIKALVSNDQEIKNGIEISPDDQGVLMRVESGLMFPPQSAVLEPNASLVLNAVIGILKEHNFDLVVRGHTDDQYIASSVYPSNWELSSSRAAAAVRYLVDKGGISPSRLKAIGYAGTRPLVPNVSETNRDMNRRVEFYYHQPQFEKW
ncbi:MAG: flagellar motor protein MotB [Deltaproteobacteria bacterium]|nr:flagellar motor protein MotB [Deltaproteobacteria bacterium]